MEREQVIQLRQILVRHFNEGELKTLCHDLGVDYDSLPGRGKASKARELVTYFERRSKLPTLVSAVERLRPDARWGGEMGEGVSRSGSHSESKPSLVREYWVRIIVAVIGALAVIIAALIGVDWIKDGDPAPMPDSFVYQVQVEDEASGESIKDAHVIIAVGGSIAPLDDYTDSQGIVVITIDASRVGKLARVNVSASGYEEYEQNITLTQGALPDIVRLEPVP